ncbi:MAG: fimbria/pilus outer membrane usher protein [Thalassobaculum sp.]|uniref:fimbria/pilus outer membrane usher protein n=1 Tax=Thalassobaculum sp. TaxID=2022740 RepID=UPI0032ECBFCB
MTTATPRTAVGARQRLGGRCRRACLVAALAGLLPVTADAQGADRPSTPPLDPTIFLAPPAPVPKQIVPETVQLEIPLRLGPDEPSEIGAVVSSSDQLLSFDGAAFVALVETHMLPGPLEAVRRQIDAAGRLAVNDLRALGLNVAYDVAQVEARVEIPTTMQKVRTLSLTRGFLSEGAAPRGPAEVSGYVNLLAARDFVSGGDADEPTVVDFDGAADILGVVVESVVTYRDDGQSRWERGDTRLVHDDPEARTRYSAGDLSYGVNGFQSFRRAGGVAVERNFGLQPDRASSPAGQSELDLDRVSRVEVMVNGQRVRTLDLPPGRYNVRDFPFVSGTNDVTLRVTDEVGRVEVLRFPFVFDTTVLGEGEHDFAYALGVPSESTPSGKSYDESDVLASAFHSYGFTDQLTVGAGLQASRDVQVLGAEGRLATPLGTFRLDGALSRLDSEPDDSGGAGQTGTGTALRLQHRFAEKPEIGGANRNLSTSVTFRSPDFSGLGQQTASNPIALDIGALYGQRIHGDLYGSIGVSHQFARYDQPDVTTADLNFSLPITDDVTAYLQVGRRQLDPGEDDNRLFLSIAWYPGRSGHRVESSYDSSRQTQRVDYTYTPLSRVDAVDADLSLSRDDSNDRLTGDIGYTGYRFDGRILQSSSVDRDGEGSENRTTLNFGTALAFADGHFGVTRPIRDSFVLFAPHPAIADQDLEINRVGDTPAARSDLLGAPVLPDLNPYYQHQVVIDAPDLPLGYELGRQIYDVRPTYRSGILIPVGTGATVLGDGVLVDAQGQPLPLELGTITAITDAERPPIEFFTSRKGRFRVEGLSPGRWRLTLANAPDRAIEFEILDGSAGRVDLGNLTYVMDQR